MNKKQYVSDDYLVVNLTGLRIVKKLDSSSSFRGEEEYDLILYYKDQEIRRQYDNKIERDVLYDKIRKELDYDENSITN